MRISFFLFFFLFLFSCDDDKDPNRIFFNDPVVDPLLNIPAEKQINFSLSGNISCQQCNEGAFKPDVLFLEITPKDHPIHTIVQTTVSGTGPFLLEKIRYAKETRLRVYGKLVADSLSQVPHSLEGVVEVKTPE